MYYRSETDVLAAYSCSRCRLYVFRNCFSRVCLFL